MAYIIILKNYYFWTTITNFTKCNIWNIFAFKNYGKFADHNLEKLCVDFDHFCPWPREGLSSKSRSLTSFFFFFWVLGLERCVFDSTSVSDQHDVYFGGLLTTNKIGWTLAFREVTAYAAVPKFFRWRVKSDPSIPGHARSSERATQFHENRK